MSEPLPESPDAPTDRLTIARLLALTAGVAAGLTIFFPNLGDEGPGDLEDLMMLATAAILGLTLPAPWFCIRQTVRGGRLGPGGMFALASGMGVLLLLPAGIIERMARVTAPYRDEGTAITCLYWVLSSMGLWYLLAAVVSGDARRLFRSETPWTERYGFVLALLWSPLGVLLLYDIYHGLL